MNQQRRVQQIISAVPTQDGAGVKLKRILGQPALRHFDPFLMLDEFGSDDPNDYLSGFPAHPHRGFQTVTYMLQGRMQHQDSVGNRGIIESGGIQWMNAGRGIIHEEMPQHSDQPMRGFQLWINLPSQEKLSPPNYQDIPAQQVPQVSTECAKVKVLAGQFENQHGPVSTQAVAPLFLDIRFHSHGQQAVAIEQQHASFVYCYDGSVKVGQQTLAAGQLATLTAGSEISLQASPDSACLILAAAPIGEPIVQHGPFVMNSKQQIQQAIDDYQNGKFTR